MISKEGSKARWLSWGKGWFMAHQPLAESWLCFLVALRQGKWDRGEENGLIPVWVLAGRVGSGWNGGVLRNLSGITERIGPVYVD